MKKLSLVCTPSHQIDNFVELQAIIHTSFGWKDRYWLIENFVTEVHLFPVSKEILITF